MSPVEQMDGSCRGKDVFLRDKLIGLGAFIGAVFLFLAGLADAKNTFIPAAIMLLLATALFCASLWLIRKKE